MIVTTKFKADVPSQPHTVAAQTPIQNNASVKASLA